jgi:nitronate monooxygenase
MWPNQRILDLFAIEIPIVQAPMAGSSDSALAVAVCQAGGLGSLPCAMLGDEQIRAEIGIIRQRTNRPLNVNFFCHSPPAVDAERAAVWRKRLAPYYRELGLDLDFVPANAGRTAFCDTTCFIVEELKPEVVSFHFGLPDPKLVQRVKAAGSHVMASATTVEEALWLEDRGCDAIIAQGAEAGGHRGMFLGMDVTRQPGTLALVPQIVDAVSVPVIAAGGIADGRGVAAAFMLGAAAVQIGTAYLHCPESLAGGIYRSALAQARDDQTVLTNVITGRPARGIVNRIIRELGPISAEAPAFPIAAGAVMPLRAKAEAAGSADFSALWAGQAAALASPLPAGDLTRRLAGDALELLGRNAQ